MIEQVYSDATFRIVTHGIVMFAVWRDAPTEDQMRALGRTSRVFAREHALKTALWNVVLSGKPSFAEAVRSEVNAQTADASLSSLGRAHVVLIDGFTGAAVRAFIGASILASRPKAPTKVFGDLATAATWLAERVAGIAGAPDAAELTRLHGVVLGQ